MALPVDKKQWMLGGALLLTLGVSAWVGLGMDKAEDAPDVVEAAKPASLKRNAAPHRAEALSLPVLANVRAAGESEQQADDLFKSHSWIVIPPPHLLAKGEVAPPPRRRHCLLLIWAPCRMTGTGSFFWPYRNVCSR